VGIEKQGDAHGVTCHEEQSLSFAPASFGISFSPLLSSRISAFFVRKSQFIMEPHRNPLNKLAHRLAVPTYPPSPLPLGSARWTLPSHLTFFLILSSFEFSWFSFSSPREHMPAVVISNLSRLRHFHHFFFPLAQSPVLLQLRGMYSFFFSFPRFHFVYIAFFFF
jgi:hypothetical protein